MAGTTNHTDEEKKAFVALAQKKGRPAAAKKAKVTPHTLSQWAKAQGVSLRGRVPRKPRKSGNGKASANGKANGKASANGKANGHVLVPASTGHLDVIERQLQTALQSVDAMRTAFRQAFGG